MSRISRVLRNLRHAIPTRSLLGRLAAGDGPAEIISLDEILSEQLDEFFPAATQGSIIYRNASVWTFLPPGTLGEFLKTNGAGADPEWAPASGGGGGETNWWFNPPAVADFATVVTEGTVNNTATADDTDAGMTIYGEPAGTDNAYLLLKAAPTAPFTLTAKILTWGQPGGNPVVGLCLRNSSTGQRLTFGTMGGNPSVVGLRQVTGTTFNANTNQFGPDHGEFLWVRYTVSAGLAATAYASADGKTWHEWATLTQANTVGAGLDQVGFSISRSDSGAESVSVTVQHYVET